MPEEVFEDLIITEYQCDEQMATNASCITDSKESGLALSTLEMNISQENTSGKEIAWAIW